MAGEEENVGKGIFGDGKSTPLYSLEASRFKGGRMFSPNVIRVWPDRIEEHENHAIRKSGTQAIHFRQVAQVGIEKGLIFTNIVVESSGGHVIRLVGVPKEDGDKVKLMIDEAVKFAHKGQPTSSAPTLDVADQLMKLASLRDSGVLTEDEFLAQKLKILST
ncbi:MAG TPA: SHOCT domain-containing protein [Acidimicrobiales bacterium]